MALFQRKKRKLGIDIGASSLKIVELSPKGDGYELHTFGSVELKRSIIRASGAELEQEIAEALVTLAKKVNVKSNIAVVALPSFSVFTAVVDLPALGDEDREFAIQSEARKYVPAPLEEVELDSKEVETIEFGDGSVGSRVLLVAAPRDYVNKFINVISKTDFKLEAVEIASFALVRSLLGSDVSTNAIIDIGASTTEISIVSNGSVYINYSVAKGGQDLTNVIQKSLNVDVTRAEQFKRDVDLSRMTEHFREPVPNAIQPVIDAIVLESKRVIESFNKQYGKKVEKVILTGGSSSIRGMEMYVNHKLKLPVVIGSPWSRIAVPEGYKKVTEEIAPSFGISAGLAMRQE